MIFLSCDLVDLNSLFVQSSHNGKHNCMGSLLNMEQTCIVLLAIVYVEFELQIYSIQVGRVLILSTPL